MSKYSDFKRYTREFFSESDDMELAAVFRELDRKGCFVMLSNSDHPRVKELYRGFAITRVAARRLINSKAERR